MCDREYAKVRSPVWFFTIRVIKHNSTLWQNTEIQAVVVSETSQAKIKKQTLRHEQELYTVVTYVYRIAGARGSHFTSGCHGNRQKNLHRSIDEQAPLTRHVILTRILFENYHEINESSLFLHLEKKSEDQRR